MNTEALIASIIFWASFAFSPGPFWMAWMSFHAQDNTVHVYKSYLPYLMGVFTLQCFGLYAVVQWFGQISPVLLLPLYFIGGGFIIYLAVKTVRSKVKKQRVSFNFRDMAGLTFLSPKVYLTVPAGALSAQYFADAWVLNGVIFAFCVLVPLNLAGSFFFLALAKLSYKVALDKVAYLSAGLLLFYGVYLFYEGVQLVMNA